MGSCLCFRFFSFALASFLFSLFLSKQTKSLFTEIDVSFRQFCQYAECSVKVQYPTRTMPLFMLMFAFHRMNQKFIMSFIFLGMHNDILADMHE